MIFDGSVVYKRRAAKTKLAKRYSFRSNADCSEILNFINPPSWINGRWGSIVHRLDGSYLFLLHVCCSLTSDSDPHHSSIVPLSSFPHFFHCAATHFEFPWTFSKTPPLMQVLGNLKKRLGKVRDISRQFLMSFRYRS